MTLPPTPSVETSLGFTLVRRGRTCPELRGEWVFRVGGPKKINEKAQNQGPQKMAQIYLSWRAPPHFVRFFGAPGFRQKRVFEIRRIFAETTANVVPKWSGLENPFLHARV